MVHVAPPTDNATAKPQHSCSWTVVVDMMRHCIGTTHDDWDEHLVAVEFAINNAYQQRTRTTPLRLTYGQNPPTPVSLRIPKVENLARFLSLCRGESKGQSSVYKQHSKARRHMDLSIGSADPHKKHKKGRHWHTEVNVHATVDWSLQSGQENSAHNI